LDAPFEALDGATGKFVFQHAILGYLKKHQKTAIIVTNQLHFLTGADRILLLNQGSVAEIGTFEELMANGKEFAKLIKQFGVFEEHNEASEKKEEESAAVMAPSPQVGHVENSHSSKAGKKSSTKKKKPEEQENKQQETDAERRKKGNLTGAEKRSTGSVAWQVYSFYIAAGGSHTTRGAFPRTFELTHFQDGVGLFCKD